jgi:molybdopterin synthase catalytic subunit
MSVLITTDDFDIAAQHEKLKSSAVGAIVTFTGTVRDLGDDEKISAMTLEHYPGMTETEIEAIVETAKSRWPLSGVTVIHRVGRLLPCDNIVFVGCASRHRQAAFEAAHFIMDFLKTNAPFWKKEDRASGAKWVDARETDYAAVNRWDKPQ